MRIAIIGAGATGLTAAWELKKRGYHDVVVFEKDDRVGGKTHSVMYKGEAFDLGSMTFSTADQTARLAEQFGIPYQQVEAKSIYLEGDRAIHPFAYARKKYSSIEIFSAYLRFRSLVRAYRIGETGYSKIAPDLFVPFQKFAQDHGIEALAYAAEPAVTGYGYGFYSEVPAVFHLKLLASMLASDFISTLFFRKSMMCFFPDGWSRVWERMAQQLVVRVGSPVTQMVFHSGKWSLSIQNGSVEQFDRVIVTSSLSSLAKIMSLDTEMESLFSEIRSYRMVSTLIEGSRALPSGFLVRNTNEDRFGHIQGIECYKPRTRCSVLFQVVPWNMRKAEIERIIREDLRVFDCRVKNIVVQKEWEYFYHVSPKGLRDGFYQKMYQQQGDRGLFFANSVFNFESVQRCQEFAQELVRTFFPDVNRTSR